MDARHTPPEALQLSLLTGNNADQHANTVQAVAKFLAELKEQELQNAGQSSDRNSSDVIQQVIVMFKSSRSLSQ